MIKEISETLINGMVKTYLTDTENFITKKQDGWDMIGFTEIGKKRNRWIPIGANVKEIIIREAETGRRIRTIDCIAYNN